MARPKQPRCRCGSDQPLPFGEDTCDVCKRVCDCGRRIPYSGRGRPAAQCPACRELDRARRICPCGRPVPSGRRRYCSAACLTEFWRTKRGGLERERWQPEWGTVEDWEGDHDAAATRVNRWLRYVHDGHTEARGDSVWSLDGEKLFTVRHTRLNFDSEGNGLPRWIPVDDVPRFDALNPEPKYGYSIVNARMTASVTLPTTGLFVEMRKSRRWIPRYGDWEYVYSMSRRHAAPARLML